MRCRCRNRGLCTMADGLRPSIRGLSFNVYLIGPLDNAGIAELINHNNTFHGLDTESQLQMLCRIFKVKELHDLPQGTAPGSNTKEGESLSQSRINEELEKIRKRNTHEKEIMREVVAEPVHPEGFDADMEATLTGKNTAPTSEAQAALPSTSTKVTKTKVAKEKAPSLKRRRPKTVQGSELKS